VLLGTQLAVPGHRKHKTADRSFREQRDSDLEIY